MTFNADKTNILAQHSIKIQKQLCKDREIEEMKKTLSNLTENSEKLEKEYQSALKCLSNLKSSHEKEQQKLQELEGRAKEIEDLKKNLSNLEEKSRRAKQSINNDKSTIRTKVLADFNRKFPRRIFGRLSSFWSCVDKSDKSFIENCLGTSINAIVVDNKATAKACIEFLKVKQLAEIDEVFLPLSEIPKQKSTVNSS